MWNEKFWGKRLGHGPFSTGLGFQWPLAPWRWLFYNPRPTEKTKTLQANWRQLKSQWRPFQTFFCYYVPRGFLPASRKWPAVYT